MIASWRSTWTKEIPKVNFPWNLSAYEIIGILFFNLCMLFIGSFNVTCSSYWIFMTFMILKMSFKCFLATHSRVNEESHLTLLQRAKFIYYQFLCLMFCCQCFLNFQYLRLQTRNAVEVGSFMSLLMCIYGHGISIMQILICNLTTKRTPW